MWKFFSACDQCRPDCTPSQSDPHTVRLHQKWHKTSIISGNHIRFTHTHITVCYLDIVHPPFQFMLGVIWQCHFVTKMSTEFLQCLNFVPSGSEVPHTWQQGNWPQFSQWLVQPLILSGVRVTVIASESMMTPKYWIWIDGSNTDLVGWTTKPKFLSIRRVSRVLVMHSHFESPNSKESSKKDVEMCPFFSVGSKHWFQQPSEQTRG